jgi:hypothetical protein
LLIAFRMRSRAESLLWVRNNWRACAREEVCPKSIDLSAWTYEIEAGGLASDAERQHVAGAAGQDQGRLERGGPAGALEREGEGQTLRQKTSIRRGDVPGEPAGKQTSANG